MRELKSHPDILLADHLQDVARRASKLIMGLGPHLQLCIPPEEIARAAFITGCTHDFGKAKRQFQDYIHGGKGKDKDHAAISSVFAFIVASQVFGQKPQPTRLLPFVCAYAVNRHHGLLCNLEEAFEEASIEHQIAVARGNIDKRIWGFVIRCKGLDLTLRFSDYRTQFEKITAQEITECFRQFSQLLRQKADEVDPSESWLVDLYFALLLVVSALTEADVACVIHAPEPKQAVLLDPERIRQYAFAQPQASPSFQKLREHAWQEIQRAIEEPDTSAFRLTLPTGLGKTLMGLYLSAAVQRQHENRQGSKPVIYALPYLSIIEQATDVARRVFPPESETGISVIQHHSLSFPESKNEEANFEKARFALEDWDADLVVTTFDQLFYSFLSQDRGFIRRFFRLPGAALLLDEVQTIPARLIPAVGTFLEKLCKKLGVRILYMTATHPPFLRDIPGIVRDEKPYFESLARTRLHLDLEPVPFSEYLSGLGDWLLQHKGRKVLLVANTIRSARNLFAHLSRLKEEAAEFRELRLFHLSGSVVPVERLRRINEIRTLRESGPGAWVCVVSTQCVEAGVDLDMDEAVRDFAPWDSMLQICGRVNRLSKRPSADVWVYLWVDDENGQGREFHSYIYDSIFTAATWDVLSRRRNVIEEREYWEIQREYVEKLEQRLSSKPSQQILRSALAWQFDKLDFRELFRGQELAWKISVFCVADRTAERLKEIAVELWSSKNPKGALKLLCELCEAGEASRPLWEFLHVEPGTVKKHAQSLHGETERRLAFRLSRLLRPMLQAYTISMPVRHLNKFAASQIAEGFPCLPREVYQALDVREGDGESQLPDWIV